MRACRERALVLQARGIPHALVQAGLEHLLVVPQALAPSAAQELALYERENDGWPPRFALPPAAPGAALSTALYALVLIAFFGLERGGVAGHAWLDSGVARSAAIRAGEWWRAVTALTLHADLVHLLSNVIYGSLFGYLVAWVLGGGLGWLVVLAAGVLGNLTNAWIQDPEHASIGASTAVFGAVGAMAGAEWRRRRIFRDTRLRRAAPLVIAVLLLSYMGVGEPGEPFDPDTYRIDVVAHVAGLAWGLPLGYAAAALEPRLVRATRGQALWGALVAALLGVAWLAALAA